MSILSGIRVVDMATYIAAPAAATILSDFGAEVIKVERPPHGDPYRYLSLVPGMPISPEHYCWLLDGRNKKSLALNLSTAGSRAVVEKLAAWCDVWITNFQPEHLQKFQLRYEDLAPLNSRMIYGHVSGYGETGAESGKPGYDATAYWARSGLMAGMHNAGADPVQSPAGFGDHPTSMALFGAIMMALYQRERTGKGAKVSTSLIANGAWSNSCPLQAAFVGAEWPERRTRTRPSNPLVNHYLSKDGRRFMLCLLVPDQDWLRLCRAFDWGQLAGDPRFNSPQTRRENSSQLVALIDARAAEKTLAEWTAVFEAHEIVWGVVPDTRDLVNDPQMEASGAFGTIEGTNWKTVMSPIHMQGEEKLKPRLAPGVGQDSEEILKRLGYSEQEIRALANSGATQLKD